MRHECKKLQDELHNPDSKKLKEYLIRLMYWYVCAAHAVGEGSQGCDSAVKCSASSPNSATFTPST